MDSWNGIGSLFIACVELILLVNLLIFTEKNRFNRTSMLMVLLLVIYQTFEFLMCWAGINASFMAYLAFVDISILPPLNLILLFRLFKYENKILNLIFIPAVSFIVYYAFTVDQFAVTSCTVLYASYNYPLGELYGFFYYLPILITIMVLVRAVQTKKDQRIKFISKVLLFGNIIISIPVVVGFTLMFSGNYVFISRMESIMCKFAFIYAVCLSIVSLFKSKGKDGRDNP